jgi:hypothetical protein
MKELKEKIKQVQEAQSLIDRLRDLSTRPVIQITTSIGLSVDLEGEQTILIAGAMLELADKIEAQTWGDAELLHSFNRAVAAGNGRGKQ